MRDKGAGKGGKGEEPGALRKGFAVGTQSSRLPKKKKR